MRCELTSCLSLPRELHLRRLVAGLLLVALMTLMGASTAMAQGPLPPPPGGGPGGDPPPPPPPVIGGFEGTNFFQDMWILSGTVAGCDDPAGITINFGGVVSGSTTTDAAGYFELTVVIPPSTQGYATAQATCPHGETSEVETYYVGDAGG